MVGPRSERTQRAELARTPPGSAGPRPGSPNPTAEAATYPGSPHPHCPPVTAGPDALAGSGSSGVSWGEQEAARGPQSLKPAQDTNPPTPAPQAPEGGGRDCPCVWPRPLACWGQRARLAAKLKATSHLVPPQGCERSPPGLSSLVCGSTSSCASGTRGVGGHGLPVRPTPTRPPRDCADRAWESEAGSNADPTWSAPRSASQPWTPALRSLRGQTPSPPTSQEARGMRHAWHLQGSALRAAGWLCSGPTYTAHHLPCRTLSAWPAHAQRRKGCWVSQLCPEFSC